MPYLIPLPTPQYKLVSGGDAFIDPFPGAIDATVHSGPVDGKITGGLLVQIPRLKA